MLNEEEIVRVGFVKREDKGSENSHLRNIIKDLRVLFPKAKYECERKSIAVIMKEIIDYKDVSSLSLFLFYFLIS